MGPFWNPLRGESLWRLSPFTGVVTLMRLPHREKDEEDHFGAAGDREIQIQSNFSFRKTTSSENITLWPALAAHL